MWVTTILVGVVIFLAVKWIRDRRSAFSTFTRMGVPGPKPELLFGNFGEIKRKGGFHPALKSWREKYGKTYGYFEATRPVLVTSDLDILRQMMIQQFSKFHGRKRFRMDGDTDKFQDMFLARGDKWKKLRTISSQLFLAKRLKEMSPIIHAVIDRVMDILEKKEQAGEPFDIYEVFQCMTMEVISNVAFGVQTDALHDPKDVFLEKSRWIFGLSQNPPFSFKIIGTVGGIFPGLYKIIRPLIHGVVIEHPATWFHTIAKRMIEGRQEEQSDRVDFISLMLKARDSGTSKFSELTANDDDDVTAESNVVSPNSKNDQKSNGDAQNKGTKAGEMLTMEEMQAQCMLFLLAGYETTSTALGYLFYELVRNPDVQEKLVQEIDEHFGNDEIPVDNQTVQKLPYMDMVVKESLRLHTIAAIAMTRCTMDNVSVNGITIPYGLDIQINPEDVHLDSDYWGPEDPHQFVPERFTKERVAERHPLAWMPFGAGPRNCVGMRLALMEIKVTLTRLFKVYTVSACDETPDELPVTFAGVKAPSQGVHVKLVKRHV